MVPDFNGLHKQTSAIAGQFSSKRTSCAASDQIKSFFISQFSDKVNHSNPTFCQNRRTQHTEKAKSAAQHHTLHPLLPKRAALQIPGKVISTQAVTPERDVTALFYDLWLAQPSWSPIIKKPNGWITIINPSGKKVPLVLGTVESHYRRGIVLGKRFGRLTNYLLIDIDTGSPFHPHNGSIKPILDAMESIGLCRYLLIRSSDSQGLHIYFPLAEPVSAGKLACAAHAVLTAAGVKVAGGICELFPNKKAFNAEHNGHRLPLQQGSFILDSDFRCTSNEKAAFMQQWQLCMAGQDGDRLAELLAEKPVPMAARISIDSLPPIAWKNIGQSNDVMRKLVNYGDQVLGLNTIPALANWIMAVAPQLPGFDAFASHESKNDLTRRGWAYRWAKSHFNSVRLYTARTSFDHNAVVAAEALERLTTALDRIVVVGKVKIGKLWLGLSAISKELFGPGFSWKLFQKHRKLILERIEASRKLGLSQGDGEGKSSSSQELAESLNPGPKKETAELLTPRCVTSIKDEGLDTSTPPYKGDEVGGRDVAELAMGTAVLYQPPGGAVEGVETRVTGKTIQSDGALLYRLEECADGTPLVVSPDCLTVVASGAAEPAQEGVIRATAAQLVQVLGKACPFVGPGRWLVKRGEVSARDWAQLCSLVGEG